MSAENERNSKASPQGRYANNFRIGFNAHEFLLDFGQLGEEHGDDEGRYHTRIVAVPINSKRLLALLEEAVKSYEDTFGTIHSPDA